MTGVFTGNWDKAWEGIKGILGGVWDFMANIVNTVLGIIGDFIGNALPSIVILILSLFSIIGAVIVSRISNPSLPAIVFLLI